MLLLVATAACLATIVSAGGEVGFAHPHRYFGRDSGVVDPDHWLGSSRRGRFFDGASASHEHHRYFRRRPHFDCGGAAFRLFNFGPHRRSFCCGGLFYEDVADSVNCCGLNIFDTRLYSCNGGASVVPLFRPSYEVDYRSFVSGRYGSGNARIAFDQNKLPFSCGTVFLGHASQHDLCCDGVYFPNPHLYYSCCGRRCFDSRWYRCSPENEIHLLDGYHHNHHPALMAHWGAPLSPYAGPLPLPHYQPRFTGEIPRVHLAKQTQVQVRAPNKSHEDKSRHHSGERVAALTMPFSHKPLPAFHSFQAPFVDWNRGIQVDGRLPQRFVVQPMNRVNQEQHKDQHKKKEAEHPHTINVPAFPDSFIHPFEEFIPNRALKQTIKGQKA